MAPCKIFCLNSANDFEGSVPQYLNFIFGEIEILVSFWSYYFIDCFYILEIDLIINTRDLKTHYQKINEWKKPK